MSDQLVTSLRALEAEWREQGKALRREPVTLASVVSGLTYEVCALRLATLLLAERVEAIKQ